MPKSSMLHLIPTPHLLRFTKQSLKLPQQWNILLGSDPAARHLYAAGRFASQIEPLTGQTCRIAVSGGTVSPADEIRTHVDPAVPHAQGYRLSISPSGVDIRARTAAGTFYAFQTLTQIVRQIALQSTKRPLSLPCVEIADQPDFERRGVYHDCARGKVPKVETLLQLIDDLAGLKINEFQLYIENAFEFRRHPSMYDDTDPFTAEDILVLDAACRARHIDFVPSLTSLGHFEKILRRPAYRQFAEVEPAELKKRGEHTWCDDPWTLCVTDPGAKQLLKEMYDEFVPNFSSDLFNICCDESWDLGKGRSLELREKIGPGQMYVDWINYCNDLSKAHGKRIQMWGDIILHHPELIPQLPEDATLLEWGYEAHHEFDQHCATFAQRIRDGSRGGSQKFYVSPGTSSWLTLAGRSRNALANIHNAAGAGLKYGATGLLVTDWGDNGHQQMLAISLNAFAYGAAAGWHLAATPNPSAGKPDWDTGRVPPPPKDADRALRPLLEAVSLQLFLDPTRKFAALAHDLGLTYERFSWQRFNGAIDWYLFREKWDFANYVNRAAPKDLPKVIAACERLAKSFEASDLLHPDAEILKAELAFTCREVIHTCKRTALRQGWLAADPAKRNPEHETLRSKPAKPLPKTFPADMKKLGTDAAKLQHEFKQLWLARNLPSRLADVDAEFNRLKQEYRKFAPK